MHKIGGLYVDNIKGFINCNIQDISNKLTEKPMHDKMNSALDPHCPRSSSSSSIARELIWKITLKK